MTSEYREDELLPLSGIQHFCFCRRQWALIHVERQWKENERTMEGRLLHKRTDDPFLIENRPGIRITRAMPVVSYQLGLYGICDVVEFRESDEGIRLHGQEGNFLPMPIEYKRGKPKSDERDEVQLCAQAICLEEMLSVQISSACMFYAQTRRRLEVNLTQTLRDRVFTLSEEMHSYFSRGYTPKVKPKKGCQACSLREICLPRLTDEQLKVRDYIDKHLDEF